MKRDLHAIDITSAIQHLPVFPKLKELLEIQQHWSECVPKKAAQHSRVEGFDGKGILCVTVESSVWAQQLTYQRLKIIKRLNRYVSQPIRDIKFSAAKWNQTPWRPHDRTSEHHPSRWHNPDPNREVSPPTDDPQRALARFRDTVERRSRHLPPCPQCGAATPPGELERWGSCCICFNQARSESSLGRRGFSP